MRIFLVVWIGQFISLLGSKLSEYALALWAYQQVGSMTQVAFLVVLLYLPNILISPIAGSLIDRWNRRWAMVFSDSVSGICSVVALILTVSGHLQLWHIYLGVPILSIASAFQAPAYSAAISQLVPKRHYGRANGMTEIPLAVSRILTPLLAALLIGIIKLQGILLIDSLTFVLALITLLSVRFPKLQPSPNQSLVEDRTQKKGDLQQLLTEAIDSWRYIRAKPRLFRLWLFIIATYFTIGMFDISFWLLVLKFGSATQFGIVISSAGCGMLLGSMVMSAWGRPKRRILGILKLTALQGFVVIVLGVGVKLSLAVASVGAFIYLFADPIIMGANRAIWQQQIPQDLQGRVFAVLLMFQRGAMIPAYLVTGLMVDRIFEPLLATSPFWQGSLGKLLGHEPGAGICLFLILLGVAKLLLAAFASQNSLLLNVERPLPPDRMPSTVKIPSH
jgi:MFS transporter, DHA3 family, macrolide efflux protein